MCGEAAAAKGTASSVCRYADFPVSSPPRYRRLRPGPGLSKEQVAAHQRSRLRRAVIELGSTDGFESLTIRALTKRARTSSGTFYRHFRGIDDLFLGTFDSVCRCASERFLEAGQDEPEPSRRLALGLRRLFQDMSANPQAARFVLWAAPAAAPTFASRLRDSEMQLAHALAASLRAAGGLQPPAVLLEGIVAALARIGRAYVPAATGDELIAVADETAEWVMGLCLPASSEPALRLASPRRRRNGAWLPPAPQAEPVEAVQGDGRGMILAAAFRIAKRGYHRLSVSSVCREAGVSRREFHRHFDGLESCFSTALEETTTRAVATSACGLLSNTWSGSVCDAARALSDAVEADADGARLLLADISAAGTDGVASRDRQISQIARTLRTTAPRDSEPSQLAAEASTAAGWALLARRASRQGSQDVASPFAPLAFLMLAPAIGGPSALRAIGSAERSKRG